MLTKRIIPRLTYRLPSKLFINNRNLSCAHAKGLLKPKQFVCSDLVLSKCQFHPQIVRKLHCSTELRCSSKPRDFLVSPFGSLYVNGSPAELLIEPLPPNDYPSQDRASVDGDSLGELKDDVTCDEKSNIIIKDIKSGSLKAVVPIKFNIGVHVSGDSILSVESLENDLTDISLDEGFCKLHNIKAETVKVRAAGASVSCTSTLQANAVIETSGQGSISLQKPLGTSVYAQSQNGDIQADSLYSNVSHFVTENGNINIKHCHRDAKFEINKSGNLIIGSLDGSVKADVANGNVEIQVSRHDVIHVLVQKGDIVIKLPAGTETALDIRGSEVMLDENLPDTDLIHSIHNGQTEIKGMVKGEGKEVPQVNTHQWKNANPQDIVPEKAGSITAHTDNGKVMVTIQSWLESLNLGKIS